MSAHARHCQRMSEAEAARDGRLRGEGLRSFERHATSCAPCRAEIRALEGLADALKQAAGPQVDELTRLRRRRELVRAASNVSETGRPRRPLLVLAATLATIAAALLIWTLRPTRTLHPGLPLAPVAFASVEGRPGARFERIREGATERIVLTDGEVSIVVRHPTGRERVVVKLPDGELEDLGTVFTVTVGNGATMRVAVTEGSVVLRLRAQAPLYLAAGTTWDRPPTTTASPAPSASSSGPPSSPVVASKVSPPPTPAPPDAAASEWKAAMEAYRAAEYRVAAARLAAFVQAHPSDAHVEDASYVRIIALQRAGDQAAMQSAAKDYLLRYPSGFRRREVEAMVASE